MSKQAGGKKNIVTKIGEEITSGGIKVIIKQDEPATEKKEKN